jgi:uncharacterized cupin superfamily protein
MAEKPIVNIVDVPLLDRGNGEKFVAKWGRVAPLLGLSNLGCAVHVVPPGKRAFPFHRHHVADELFFIVSGEGEYRWGNKVFPLRPGDIIAAPAGTESHQIINTGDGELRYLGISTLGSVDVVDYLSLPASRMPIFPRRHLEGWAASSQPTISTARRETRVTSKA